MFNPLKISAKGIYFRSATTISVLALLAEVSSGNWEAAPIVVHEWGVNTFDWNTGDRLIQELPDFLYTDKRPGTALDPPEVRVRDLPPDSGIRTKPILYFYPGERLGRGATEARVGVEMRFAFGYANAWWPQVHRYRTEEMSAKAGPPDWETWKAKALKNHQLKFLQNDDDGKAQERWAAESDLYQKLSPEDQIQRLTGFSRLGQIPDFPDDERMQLTWEELTLHPEVPDKQTLAGAALGEDHWVKIARDVDAAYVSNGKETERYLFYEGKTSEEPAIALLPADRGVHPWMSWVQGDQKSGEVSLVNVGEETIYDVIAIYRNREKGILWTGSLPVLPPRTIALRIPDFEKPRESDNLQISRDEFRRLTTERLLENLTAGTPVIPREMRIRDPADSQGPTQSHQLFMKEAIGLEKIWHDDFFEAEGLTVIYRESPAYLDEAMPLNLFTSMYWHIQLSRCGLVLNRNLPLDEVHATENALSQFQMAEWNPHLELDLKDVIPQLKKNRLLTLGQTRFYLSDGSSREHSGLEKIRKLLD